jgi:hypothetical protein
VHGQVRHKNCEPINQGVRRHRHAPKWRESSAGPLKLNWGRVAKSQGRPRRLWEASGMEGRGADQRGSQPENRRGMRIPDCKQPRDGLLLTRLAPGSPHAFAVIVPNSECAQTPHRGVCKSCRFLACPRRYLFCFQADGCTDAGGEANETAEKIPLLRHWMPCVLSDARCGVSSFLFGGIQNRQPLAKDEGMTTAPSPALRFQGYANKSDSP